MIQRGRTSNNLHVVDVDRSPSRLHPPTGLRKDERALFAQIVASRDPKHFVESDLPLLVSYVQASLMAHRMAHKSDKVADWERAVRIQCALATKLRLSPQTRVDRKLSTLRPGNPPSIYERMALDED